MDRKLRQQKIKMWQGTLKQLEEELKAITAKKSQVAQDGDLSENVAYKIATEDAETTRVRIEEVKKIIADLESRN